jgi:hypothetical protein
LGLVGKNSTEVYIARLVFILIPTWVLSFLLLWLSNQYFAVIQQQQYLYQAVFLGLGMIASAIFYLWRFRFVPTFAILLIIFYFAYKSIDKFSYGEFDAFFYSVQLLLFAILFSLGWMFSWACTRFKWFSVLIAAAYFLLGLALIGKQPIISFEGLMQLFLPILFYTFYTIYASQLIDRHQDYTQSYWWYLLRRLFLFLLLLAVITWAVVSLTKAQFVSEVENYGSGASRGQSSMLQKNKDGSFSLAEYTKLRGNLGRSNELLFVAKINNFFEEDIPNPLYLTGFYYSKYDPITETFEQDTLLPDSDLFRPDPSKLGLYFTQVDSSVLRDALKSQHTKTVDIEVYKTLLNAEEFVAPTTSFFVQPIAIDKDNKDEYTSAYRAKSLVSDLNSAYFVYNAGDNFMLEQFQEMRYSILRKVNDYSGMDKAVFDYYTDLPAQGKFESIVHLAKEITKGKTNNLDKIVAIRDFFLSKDEQGKPLFKYSDNPGIPDIPSASKLNYFLFENRKGYCAYYAGATLFMLRSLGIPSRIVAGFLTQDRSAGNNKGWYWYYADQAHAWVQVYFPGYGWIDFDTTIGNEDAQNAPKPDGTPPNTPGNALFAVEGIIKEVDTIGKTANIEGLKLVFKDQLFDSLATPMHLDLKVAVIEKDSLKITVAELNKGDTVTAVSFAEIYKGIALAKDINNILLKLPQSAPIDELKVKVHRVKAQEQARDDNLSSKKADWKRNLIILCLVIFVLLLLFWAFAWIYKLYLQLRSKTAKTLKERAFWDFRYTQFVLHQLGYERDGKSALVFAIEVDKQLQLNYSSFVGNYLSIKYNNEDIGTQLAASIKSYKAGFEQHLISKIRASQRFRKFLNPLRTISFIKSID